jgi:hypothetical protein
MWKYKGMKKYRILNIKTGKDYILGQGEIIVGTRTGTPAVITDFYYSKPVLIDMSVWELRIEEIQECAAAPNCLSSTEEQPCLKDTIFMLMTTENMESIGPKNPIQEETLSNGEISPKLSNYSNTVISLTEKDADGWTGMISVPVLKKKRGRPPGSKNKVKRNAN